MLVYAIVLILVMLATNNDTFKAFLGRLKPGAKKKKGGRLTWQNWLRSLPRA